MNQIIKKTIILLLLLWLQVSVWGTVHEVTLDPIAQAQEAAATKTLWSGSFPGSGKILMNR